MKEQRAEGERGEVERARVQEGKSRGKSRAEARVEQRRE